jgi:hypothetical protein
MLSDQRSPYVGRFARGWHRLPGRFPGQPQTRTWARRRIGTTARNAQRRDGIVERASRGHEVDPAGAGRGEGFGARRGRRPGREDVIDEKDPLRRCARRIEAPPHRRSALGAAPPGLGTRGSRAVEQAHDRDPRSVSEPHGKRPGLVVSALGEPSTRKGHPRDDIDGWQIVTRRDRRGEGPCHITPSRELEAVHSASRRTVEEERRPSRRHRVRRAVTAGRHRHAGRATAPVAPGTPERHQRHTARGTERPRPGPASGAPAWEDDIERPREHAATVPATADIVRAERPRPVRFP